MNRVECSRLEPEIEELRPAPDVLEAFGVLKRLPYCLFLDSARFMHAAHALYRSSGFQEIAPYPESEIPEEFRPNWIFMEKLL